MHGATIKISDTSIFIVNPEERGTELLLMILHKDKGLKQSRYRPGVSQRVPGS